MTRSEWNTAVYHLNLSYQRLKTRMRRLDEDFDTYEGKRQRLCVIDQFLRVAEGTAEFKEQGFQISEVDNV